MKVAVQHGLAADAAWERVKKCIETLKNDHADKVSYAEVNCEANPATIKLGLRVPRFFRLSGILHVSATLSVTQDEVVVEGPLPLGAGPWESSIEGIIRDHLKKCLA